MLISLPYRNQTLSPASYLYWLALYSSKDGYGAIFTRQKPELEHSLLFSDWLHIHLTMGMVLSSPYRNQILSIALGLLLLVTGFILLLLSIGLEEMIWRIIGSIVTALGGALVLGGSCWCIFAVRNCKYTTGTLRLNVESEVETLTSELV